MNIFDIFTFKKEGAKVFSREHFKEILEAARQAIISQVKANLAGSEKKKIVDEFIVVKILSYGNGCRNKAVLWILNQVVLAVPTITQLVYDFLKEKVENL